MLPLTDLKVISAKPREKIYKLSDGGGLYLAVTPLGTKLWHMSYTQANVTSLSVAPKLQKTRHIGRAFAVVFGDTSYCRVDTTRFELIFLHHFINSASGTTKHRPNGNTGSGNSTDSTQYRQSSNCCHTSRCASCHFNQTRNKSHCHLHEKLAGH